MSKKIPTQASFLQRITGLPGLRACIGAGALLLAGLTAPVMAQPVGAAAKPQLDAAAKKVVAAELTQFVVVKAANGREQLLDASSVKPGDVLEYRVTYTNNSGKAVTGLVADLPIPEGLEYVPRSAKPGADLVKAAVKDGEYSAEPLMRKGKANKPEPVPYAEYRALRWTLGQLPAGGVAAVSARAKVEVVIPPAPKTSSSASQAPPLAVQSAATGASR
jgi:uncharacterized repeat protein (TIGR01451 family)